MSPKHAEFSKMRPEWAMVWKFNRLIGKSMDFKCRLGPEHINAALFRDFTYGFADEGTIEAATALGFVTANALIKATLTGKAYIQNVEFVYKKTFFRERKTIPGAKELHFRPCDVLYVWTRFGRSNLPLDRGLVEAIIIFCPGLLGRNLLERILETKILTTREIADTLMPCGHGATLAYESVTGEMLRGSLCHKDASVRPAGGELDRAASCEGSRRITSDTSTDVHLWKLDDQHGLPASALSVHVASDEYKLGVQEHELEDICVEADDEDMHVADVVQ